MNRKIIGGLLNGTNVNDLENHLLFEIFLNLIPQKIRHVKAKRFTYESENVCDYNFECCIKAERLIKINNKISNI